MLVSEKIASPQGVTSERATEATSRLKKVLNLTDLTSADNKRLSLAIAEVVAEEAEENSRFADRIYRLYQELAPNKVKGRKKEELQYTGEDLVPITSAVGYSINVYGPPDPYELLKIYGKEQLPKALSLYKPAKLKETVARLMEEHPGSKPRTKTKPEDLIDYIVKQTT